MWLNIVISMCTAEDMDRKDMELRKTIRTLWPIHAKKMQNLLVPPNEGNNSCLKVIMAVCGSFLSVECTGSAVECQILNQESPGSNPLLPEHFEAWAVSYQLHK